MIASCKTAFIAFLSLATLGLTNGFADNGSSGIGSAHVVLLGAGISATTLGHRLAVVDQQIVDQNTKTPILSVSPLSKGQVAEIVAKDSLGVWSKAHLGALEGYEQIPALVSRLPSFKATDDSVLGRWIVCREEQCLLLRALTRHHPGVNQVIGSLSYQSTSN